MDTRALRVSRKQECALEAKGLSDACANRKRALLSRSCTNHGSAFLADQQSYAYRDPRSRRGETKWAIAYRRSASDQPLMPMSSAVADATCGEARLAQSKSERDRSLLPERETPCRLRRLSAWASEQG